MVKPFTQHIAQRHDTRNFTFRKHIHVEWNARFKFGVAEHLLHQNFRINVAGFRFQHHAHIFSGLVAHITQQGEFLIVEQFRHALNKAAFLHQIWNFSDDDLPATPGQLFFFPTAAHAETTFASFICFNNIIMLIGDDAARGEIWPQHKLR